MVYLCGGFDIVILEFIKDIDFNKLSEICRNSRMCTKTGHDVQKIVTRETYKIKSK
jgi:hypothetical protein